MHRSALSVALAMAFSSGALAQSTTAQTQEDTSQDATNLSKITVTGSNIPRTSTETASPVQVISRQEIDRTGKTSIGEYLQSLTVDGAGSVPKTFGNGFAMGSTGISLRGLGAGSTLVLINGRRVASYGLADDGQKVFTDLSSIPMDAVERVEVLKDGASSIYGSDAIAGVVNVILRSDFEGAIFTGSYGTSGDSDGNTRKGTLTAGTGNLDKDGWNAFFSLDVSKTDGIKISDRKNRKWIGTGDIRPWGYSSANGASQYLGGGLNGGLPTNAPDGAYENADGNWTRLGGCEQFSNLPQEGNNTCLWDLGQFRDLTPDEKAINFFSRGTFRISDNADFYTEFGYSKKTVDFQNTPSGTSGAWGYPGGPVNASSGPGAIVLGPDHPQNPTGEPVRLRYSAFDVGPRQTHNENEFMRFLVGVKGTAGEWDYDAGYLHSQSQLTNTRKGFLSYSAVQCALADPNCAGGTWMLGTQAGQNPQSLYDFISPTISARATSRLDIIDAKANRSLMDLGGGSLGLAVGAEFRRNEVSLTPQTGTETGDIIGLGYSAYDGVEKTSAVYAELAAPFTETFEATVAGRVDHYQGGDTAFTPKVGLKWTPAEWIALRATYAEGFRAPNPAESGKGGSAGFSNIVDPVRCAADASLCGAQSVALITTPNADLDPEKSKSYTLGIVLQPTSSTTLTLDAWQIKRTDEIGGGDPQQAIAAGDVIRGDNLVNGIPGTGQLLAINTAYVNADSTKVNGLDLDARQRFDLGEAGQLRLDLQWSHINKFEKTVGDTTYEYAGTHGNCDVTNCIGTPKDRINFGATWDISDFSVSAIANYRSSIDNKTAKGEDCASNYADGSPAPGSCKLASFTTVDLSGNWQATDAFSVFASVQNVADRIAPLDPLSYGGFNYNPLDSSGAIGRFFTLGARYTF